MSELFRQEALEHHGGARATGDVLRLTPRWTNWLFWAVLVLVLAGLAAGWVVRVDGRRLISVLLGLE